MRTAAFLAGLMAYQAGLAAAAGWWGHCTVAFVACVLCLCFAIEPELLEIGQEADEQ